MRVCEAGPPTSTFDTPVTPRAGPAPTPPTRESDDREPPPAVDGAANSATAWEWDGNDRQASSD